MRRIVARLPATYPMPKSLANAKKVSMEKNQFQFDQQLFRLTHGTCMENVSGRLVSNAFMWSFEIDLEKISDFM